MLLIIFIFLSSSCFKIVILFLIWWWAWQHDSRLHGFDLSRQKIDYWTSKCLDLSCLLPLVWLSSSLDPLQPSPLTCLDSIRLGLLQKQGNPDGNEANLIFKKCAWESKCCSGWFGSAWNWHLGSQFHIWVCCVIIVGSLWSTTLFLLRNWFDKYVGKIYAKEKQQDLQGKVKDLWQIWGKTHTVLSITIQLFDAN